MPDTTQLRDAVQQLLNALNGQEGGDEELAARLRELLNGGAPAATSPPAIDRAFIREQIIPELERYWRRQQGQA